MQSTFKSVIFKLKLLGNCIPVAGREGSQICNDAGTQQHVACQVLRCYLRNIRSRSESERKQSHDARQICMEWPRLCRLGHAFNPRKSFMGAALTAEEMEHPGRDHSERLAMCTFAMSTGSQ